MSKIARAQIDNRPVVLVPVLIWDAMADERALLRAAIRRYQIACQPLAARMRAHPELLPGDHLDETAAARRALFALVAPAPTGEEA